MFKKNRQLIKTILNNYEDFINKKVVLYGWIDTIRIQQNNGIAFISLNDGSCIKSIQLVLNPSDNTDYDTIYSDGTKGVSIKASGTIIKSPAKGQEIEMDCKTISILGKVNASEYPIAKKKLPLEHIRKFPQIRIKTKTISAIARLRHTCSIATHTFFNMHDFKYVHTPIITSNDCEGAGETFNLKDDSFFDKNVNLTVSGQLHGETFACGLGDIYTFGPTFRAETSHTTRHLSEFWMIEPEMCFINLTDLMNIAEDYIKYCINACLTECREEILFFTQHYKSTLYEDLKIMMIKPFTRMTYKEVIDTINTDIKEGRAIIKQPECTPKTFKKMAKGKHVFEGPLNTTDNLLPENYDLDSEHEKYIVNKTNGIVIVSNYPKEIKSFYMKENKDGKTVQAMDILVPDIGELVGGSMREENYDILKQKMDAKNIDIPWYLDIRKYGSVPHGGFGLGFERLIMLVSGLSNIKDIIPYPRFPKQCEC